MLVRLAQRCDDADRQAQELSHLRGAAEPSRERSGRESPELSYSDRERLRSLEMTLASSGATSEQKEGARMEINSIRSGRESRMSRGDRDLRDSLNVDLGSVDRKKRNEALRQIRDIYYR